MTIDFKKIGKNIERRREERDLNREEIARILSISENKIKNIEEGIEKIDIVNLIGISKVLKVSVDEILETNIKEDNIFEEMKNIFQMCDEKQKNTIISLSKMVLEYKI